MRIRDFDTPVMDKVYDAEVALDERYVGETPAIKHVFELFCKFRNKYTDNKFRKSMKINGDEDLQTFCDACAELWGLDSFSMIIEQANIFQFATISTDMRIDLPLNRESIVEYGPNGVRFKSKYRVNILSIGFTGLIMNERFTNREVFGVFLHEIGHSFQSATNGTMLSLNKVNMFIRAAYVLSQVISDPIHGFSNLFKMTLATNGMVGLSAKLHKSLMRFPAFRIISNIMGIFRGALMDVFYTIKFTAKGIIVPAMFPAQIAAGVTSLLYPSIFIHNYGGEQMADSFAADLGFGPDLSSAFIKQAKYGNELDLINKIPVLNAIVDLWCLPFNIMTQFFNEHPMTGTRIYGTLEIMKNDYNKGYVDPKMKKALEKDIKAIEKSIDDFNKEPSIKNPENRQIFSAALVLAAIDEEGGTKYKLLKGIIDPSEEKQKAFERNQNQATGNVIKL